MDNRHLPAHREHLDLRQIGRRLRPQVGVAVVADVPQGGDVRVELVVRRRAPDHRPKIVAVLFVSQVPPLTG